MELPELYRIFTQSSAVNTDSRKITGGSLFFALHGERFNGNRFAPDALKKGAFRAVVDDRSFEGRTGYIVVDDTLKTLQDLARYHRQSLHMPVIGIAGSNGKTTTKELTGAVLGSRYKTFSTPGNLNNHIGLPLAVLRIERDHEFAVIEMGANQPGENRLLADIARPDHGLVTNIGKDHLAGFGDLEGVKNAYKEFYDHLAEHEGKAFLNQDDPDLLELIPQELSTIRYGSNQNEVFCKGTPQNTDTPFLSVEWYWKGDPMPPIDSNLAGHFNLYNILAAACIGKFFGISGDRISKAIADHQPTKNRSRLFSTERNQIFLDAYNANPTSMIAAIDSLAEMKHEKKYVILGDMLEMGEQSLKEHQGVLKQLRERGITEGLLIGNEFKEAVENIPSPISFQVFGSKQEAIPYLREANIKNRLILIKGSRALGLEELKELL